MFHLLRFLSVLVSQLLRSRSDLVLENLALRQQLAILNRRKPQPQFVPSDRLFWVLLRHFWSEWKQALILVQPKTVVRWHRAGFRAYWTWLSRHRTRPGRKRISVESRELIFRMVAENPTWGAPRIHGELAMLGFDVSERTVRRSDTPVGGVSQQSSGSHRRDGLLHRSDFDVWCAVLLLRHCA
jgi:putative transposase